MPDQSSNATALRTGNHVLRAYAAFYVPALAAAGTITADTVNPDSGLAVSFTTGSETDVERGFLINFYTSAGAYKGSSRIRYSGVISSGNLPTREKSWGTVKVENGDLFNVMRFVPLSDKLPEATEEFNPDGIDVSDFGENPPGVCHSGNPIAQFTDDGQTYATITLPGSTSYVVDPDSSSSPTFVTTLPTGAGSYAPGSANTDTSPTVRFNVGHWLVKRVMTDVDNSKTITQFVPVMVFSASSPPHECVISAYSGTLEDGYNAEIQVFDDANLDTIPDGTLCILFKREFINGSAQSFGSPVSGRSHILFTGYLRRDVTRYSDGVETLTFSVISPLSRLNELVGYSKVMLSEASPDSWNELKTLTTKRAVIQIIQFYTNLIEAGYDVVFASNYTNQLYPAFYLNESSPLAQIRELVYATDAEFACNRQGRFLVYTPQDLLPLASRSSTVIILQVTAADVLSYEVTREHWRPVRLTRISGLSAGASGNVAAFAKWPGTPGEGNVQTSYERLIFDATDPNTDAYERSGRWGARNDGWYVNADGEGQFAPKLTITLAGAYDTVFDYYGEVFRFAQSLVLREIALDDFDWILETISVEYIGGTARTTIQARAATNGNEGLDDTPPPGEPVDPPDDDPPEYDTNPALLGRGTGNIAVFCTDNYVYVTTNFTSATPTWTRYALAVTGNITGFVVDASSPRYFGTGTEVNGWIATDSTSAIYRITDIFGTTGSPRALTLIYTANAAAVRYRAIESNFGAIGHLVIVSYYEAHGTYPGTWLAYSTNANSGSPSFTEYQLDGAYASGAPGYIQPSLALSSRSPGSGLVGVVTTTSIIGSSDFYSISSGFATKTLVTSPSNFDPTRYSLAIHLPFNNNESDLVWYYGRYADAFGGGFPGNRGVFRRNGDTVDDITPTVDGAKGLPAPGQRSITTCPIDRQRVVLLGWNGDTGNVAMFTSIDTGTTWVKRIDETGLTSAYWQAAIAGNDRDLIYLWGAGGTIGLSGDFGATISDKRGNIPTDYPSAATFLNICGG